MSETDKTREMPRGIKGHLKGMRETQQVCRWVWRELISYRARRWSKLMVGALLLMTVFQLASPYAVGYIFDGAVTRQFDMLLLGFGGFFLFMLLEKICDYYRSRAFEVVIGTVLGDVDRRVSELFFEKSMGQHIQEGSSLNASNVEKGRASVRSIIDMLLYRGVEVLSVFLISFLFLFVLSPVAGLIMGVIVVIHLLFSIYMNREAIETCGPIEKEWRRLHCHRTERWEKMERVKTCAKEDEEMGYMNSWWDSIIAKDLAFWLWFNNMDQLRHVVNIVGSGAIMGYGVYLVWNEIWMIGALYPLYSWSVRVSENIREIGWLEREFNWNMPSVRAMIKALSIKPDVVSDPSSPAVKESKSLKVAFDNISYTYPKGSREEGTQDEKFAVPVVRNVSFEVGAGEKVALIGPSGVGKTTVMRLLLRYMDPDEGCIRLNGFKLHEVDLESWMRMVGYIPQQALVLDGTIRYNLTYGLTPEEKERITDEELWGLMSLLQIDFGDRLADGLDTVVGRDGVKLSGGQAQRLMIGAAAIKKPSFMIIDEATSNLDSTTEKKVYEGLVAEVLSDKVSALVIAHRLATVRHVCDKFVVLREIGELEDEASSQVEAEASSFEELYRISPTFRRLADDQGVVIEGEVNSV